MSLMPATSELEIFRKSVREFCTKELAPNSEEWEAAGVFPKELFLRFGEMGYFGIQYPESLGGSALDHWYVSAYIEEMAHARNIGLTMAMLVQSDMATPVINAIGSDEQKEEFLRPAISGERVAALGISEPDAGSDVAQVRTTARRDGDDYVVNGSKTYITNGTRADFMTLAVRTGEEGHRGVSLLLFPTDVKGFSVSKSLKKLGNCSSDTALVFFEDCRVPARCLLGEENRGFYYAMSNFQGERLVAALMAVSNMQLMWDDALAYSQQRVAFGRPVAKFQVWRHRLAELATQIEAARQLTYFAVDCFMKNEDASREVTMAKLFGTDLAQRVAYECLQIHGGAGYMAEYDISRMSRDVRLWTIGAGTSEIMKEIVASKVGL